MPMVVLVLASGLIGYSQLANRLLPRRGGRAALVLAWLAAAALGGYGTREVARRVNSVPDAIDRREAEAIWAWVEPGRPRRRRDRRLRGLRPALVPARLYSYIMDTNLPPGFPQLDPEFTWLFVENEWRWLKPLLDHGFDVVHRGRYLTVARRRTLSFARDPDPPGRRVARPTDR